MRKFARGLVFCCPRPTLDRSPPALMLLFLAEGEGLEPYAVARTSDQCQATLLRWFTPCIDAVIFGRGRGTRTLCGCPHHRPMSGGPPRTVRPLPIFDKSVRLKVSPNSTVGTHFPQGLFTGLDIFYGWAFDASVSIPHFESE